MGMPRKLKNLNLFNNGVTYIGQVGEVTPPKLARKLESWRGGGMDGGGFWMVVHGGSLCLVP